MASTKNVNVSYTNEVHEALNDIRVRSGLTWPDFIVEAAYYYSFVLEDQENR